MNWETVPMGVLISALCCLAYTIAVSGFYRKYMEISRIKEKLFICIYFVGIMGIMTFYEQYGFPYIVYVLSEHFFFLAMTAWLFQAETEKKILAASLLITVRTLVWGFCQSFLFCFILMFLYVVKGEKVPVIDIRGEYLIVCFSFAAGIWVIWFLGKNLKAVLNGKTGKWYTMLTVPLLVIVMIADIQGWGATYGILVRGRDEWNLYYNQIFSYLGNCVFTALSMAAAGFYIYGMDKIYVEQRKMMQYQSQIEAYKMLEGQYGRMERLRHDMKNHIIGLKSMLANGDIDKMEQYLKQMQKAGDMEPGEEATGNKVVDALLYQNRKLAEEKKILWECHVQIPKKLFIDELDLCVLFGNLLDNAMEACERLPEDKKPFIKVEARMVKKCFLMEMKNSTDLSKTMEIGATRKENPQAHGIGLLNVNDVVQKYNGVMNTEVGENVFVISVLLPLKETVHDRKQTV